MQEKQKNTNSLGEIKSANITVVTQTKGAEKNLKLKVDILFSRSDIN